MKKHRGSAYDAHRALVHDLREARAALATMKRERDIALSERLAALEERDAARDELARVRRQPVRPSRNAEVKRDA